MDTMQFYAPMNNSIARARRLAEEKGMRDDTYTQQMRGSELADADQMRRLRDSQFGENSRQFDTKANIFREMLAQKMPDFFGGGQMAQPQTGYGGGMRSGSLDLPGTGYGDAGLDAATRNYLLRYLQMR